MNARTLKALRLLLVMACLAGAAVAAGVAVARVSTHPTQLTIDGIYGINAQRNDVYGSITSEEKRCIPGRRVKVYVQPTSGDSFGQVDTAFTSQNGAWMGYGQGDTLPNAVKAKVTRSTFGPKGHRQICASKSEIFLLDK